MYFGGMDYNTCNSMSQRMNVPIDDVYAMPLEQVIVIRRGTRPVQARRYQTYNDPLHIELFGPDELDH